MHLLCKIIFIHLLYKIIFLLLISSSNAESQEPLGQFCNQNTNITKGGKLSANIDQLLAQLVSKTPSSGFVSALIGEDQGQVYGLSQCRGDVSKEDCSICVQDAANKSEKDVQTKLMQESGMTIAS